MLISGAAPSAASANEMLEMRITMVLPGIVDEWNYWTDGCDPQEFMNLSRAQGHSTIGAAVDAFVVAIPGRDHAWAGLNAEELEEIRDVLV
jgi:hypothetical protein